MRHPLKKGGLRAIVFDFDGTLAVQTLDFALMRDRAHAALSRIVPPDLWGRWEGTQVEPAGPQSTSRILEDGAALQAAVKSKQLHEKGKGGPLMEELAMICGSLAESDPELAKKARGEALQAVAAVEMEAARDSTLFPFVRPMLFVLKDAGVNCAVITRNCREAVMTVFPDINEHMACVLTRDDVEKVKPDPSHLLAALDILGCEPRCALMVGDHPMDIVTGKRAATRTAAVASGHTALGVLVKEKPDLLARDAGELMRWLGFTI